VRSSDYTRGNEGGTDVRPQVLEKLADKRLDFGVIEKPFSPIVFG
jgi:hypothetical protein